MKASPAVDLRRILADNIAKAERPGYVYTYPPKRAFRPLDDTFSVADSWDDEGERVNIYVHIPFCPVRCRFCNLFTLPITGSSPKRGMFASYTDSLVREIESYGPLVGHREVESIYFGGGTPSYLDFEDLERIVGTIDDVFVHDVDDIERCIEVYPDNVLEPGKLEALQRLGFNRLSFGIQTFDATELRATGRPYPAELGLEVLRRVTELGFADVNADLIYGLPHQTFESWLHNVELVADLGLPTLTLYPLMIRPVTAYYKQEQSHKVEFVPDRTKFEWHDAAREILERAGYRQETAVVFVKAGTGGGYQQQYREFGGTPTLGVGAGARSSAPNAHYSTDYAVAFQPTLAIIEDYVDSIDAGRTAARFGFVLDDDEKVRRYAVQALQLPRGIDEDVFEAETGVRIDGYFPGALEALEEEGCLERTDGRLRLTDRGVKYSDICVTLFFSERVSTLEAEYRPV